MIFIWYYDDVLIFCNFFFFFKKRPIFELQKDSNIVEIEQIDNSLSQFISKNGSISIISCSNVFSINEIWTFNFDFSKNTNEKENLFDDKYEASRKLLMKVMQNE